MLDEPRSLHILFGWMSVVQPNAQRPLEPWYSECGPNGPTTVRTVCLEDLTARSLLEVDRFGYIWIIWDIYVYFNDIFVYSFDKSGAVYLKSESLEMSWYVWMLVFKDLFSKIIRNDQQIRELLDIHAISCYCYRKPSSILQSLLILSSPIRMKKYWANPTHLETFSRSQSSRGRHMRPLSCYFHGWFIAFLSHG